MLDQGLAEIGLAASEGQKAALLQLAELLEAWAERVNLTAHRTRDAILHRLILDAAALARVLPDAREIADLGSGAGFPGLPLAILRPESRVTLVEARERRHYFQRAALRALRLANARALRGRAEGLPASPHDLVVAQALARPASALQWMLPWATPGGALAIPGSSTPPEIEPVSGVRLDKILTYTVPCGGPARTVWLGRRTIEG
ncbi:MAG TPA: RsmG family class I SAM-dependent methyltransferase [Myxococcota bacterium]